MLLSIFFSFSQENKKADSIPVFQIQLLKVNYKDFIVIDQNVYAITMGDSLVVYDLIYESIKFIKPNVLGIVKTTKNKIYHIDNQRNINLTTNFKKSKICGKFEGDFMNLIVDNNDNYAVLTSKGFFYKNRAYVPSFETRSFAPNYNSKDKKTKYFTAPNVLFIDSKNNLWLTFDYGEFGTDQVFFNFDKKIFFESNDFDVDDLPDTSPRFFSSGDYEKMLTKRFPSKVKEVNNKIVYTFPNNLPIYHGVKGIAENKEGDILISQSLMHFSVQGCLGLYTASEIKDFYYSERIKNVLEYNSKFKENDSLAILQEYLGPTCFNPFNNYFYYYSDKGFFKILKTKDVYSKELFFKPLITWTFGMSHSVGYEMSIKKFEFISSNELIFLTSNNGIGYFDGKVVKYFK